MSTIIATLPLRLTSPGNGSHGHWRARAKAAKRQRSSAHIALLAQRPGATVALPVLVVLTRIAPRPLDDDNNVAAFKRVRDGVADYLGVKDNDPRVEWRYEQERRGVREYAVRIKLVFLADGGAP